MNNNGNCIFYNFEKFNFKLKYEEISKLTNKDFIHSDITLFQEDILKNPYIRSFFQEYIQNNFMKIEKRVQNYLIKDYKKTGKYDVPLNVFFRLILDFCKNKKEFDDIILNATETVFNRFLSIIFISDKDISNIVKNTLENLKYEKEFLTENEFNIIFQNELFEALKT